MKLLWSCHPHNHNGICHRCRHDDQFLFSEVYHHINYTLNIIFIFWANDLSCVWRHFSLQPLDSEHAILEDPAAVFSLKIWRFCYCSIVPYTADVICSFDFFFHDTEAQWKWTVIHFLYTRNYSSSCIWLIFLQEYFK